MVDDTDVLVVGGGQAGLSTAAAAAARGARVLVVERRPRIGDPVHTSGATATTTVERFGIPRGLASSRRPPRRRSTTGRRRSA